MAWGFCFKIHLFIYLQGRIYKENENIQSTGYGSLPKWPQCAAIMARISQSQEPRTPAESPTLVQGSKHLDQAY